MSTWLRRTSSAPATTFSDLRISLARSLCHASRIGRCAWMAWGWTLSLSLAPARWDWALHLCRGALANSMVLDAA
eukprot:2766991-Pyramimonas_sp.AAC.1